MDKKHEIKKQITRKSVLSPRLDYAAELVDRILVTLVQKKFELHTNNLSLYIKKNDDIHTSLEFKKQINMELEIFRSVEALRQVRNQIDSIFVLADILLVLAPTISIVRTVRSGLYGLFSDTDTALGELSVVLGGLIIDSGQLTNARLDFEKANHDSNRLLDEAKLIADSKISKQFPNLDLS